MNSILIKIWTFSSLLLLSNIVTFSQGISLDNFETTTGWNFIKSDGVELNFSIEKGLTNNAIRFDYNFTKGTGYGGIQKWFPIDLPENYEITFWVKAQSPSNNFEIKFIDSTGNNVWWVNNRNYQFPGEWKKIRIKKRHISFAWGPTHDKNLKRIDRVEFTVASFVGGKGTIWIDDLRFEPLSPETETYPTPRISATSSTKNKNPELVFDNSEKTFWQSQKNEGQSITIDFTTSREFGGLQIDWLNDHFASNFEVLLSDDAKKWERVHMVEQNDVDKSFINLPESESRYLKINLLKGNQKNVFGISELKIFSIKNSLTINDFFKYVANNSPEGDYPRYFLDQASYWTVTGVNNDTREALINEDGMVEVDKALFSIEPMIKLGEDLFNWSNVNSSQGLHFPNKKDELGFTPSVTWQCNDIEFVTGVSSTGDANLNSRLNIGYYFKNTSAQAKDFEFYLLIRPFQVNPLYQFLNLPGGVGWANSIKEVERGKSIAVDEKTIYSLLDYNSFSAYIFDNGSIIERIRTGKLSPQEAATDADGLANGVIKYNIHLEAGKGTRFFVVVPYHGNHLTDSQLSNERVNNDFIQSSEFWKSRVSHIKFNLPKSANRIIDSYKSNLVYIMINRDKAGIQPGSRSYERSWIRDGSLTSSALLKSGIVEEVKDFIDWYAIHQYENGKVPCVVDFRGPDPVPEHDSHGQLIYLIKEYFNFTKDTAFLRSKNEYVLKAVDYIETLVGERSTDYFKNGNDSIRAYYGLVPESISHEGYSEKPMHSYWDNFFIMKGLKDAVDIQKILGEQKDFERIAKIRDSFRENLYTSLQLAMKTRSIDYIPGCVELGDFDATSTTIALTPCNEYKNLPKPQVYNTFDKYYDFFVKRRDGLKEWVNYTPYENRLIGSFIFLDQPERAHELIEFFLNDQRPHAWNHWAEVVWKDYRMPRFIGDMPHTWVGSDFINAIRSIFVYENEYDHTLDIAAALYQDWIDSPDGMSVENLPTYYGDISYSIKKENDSYRFSISGKVDIPENGIRIRNFNGFKLPKKVTINNNESKEFTSKEIAVKEFPAEVVIYY